MVLLNLITVMIVFSCMFLSKFAIHYNKLPSIDGEYVPIEGDVVEYRKMLIPPKNEKYQAVHVRIVNLSPEKHKTWDEPA